MSAAPPGTPCELAVVVLAVGAPPELRAAVESLLAQDEPLEIVVVNSGGGDLARVLPENPAIRTVSCAELLWPGAARNAGIRATRAPWIAFLASDLVAAPGWAAGRLARHRAGAMSVASAIRNDQASNLFAWASHVSLHARRMEGVSKRRALRYGASYARALFDHYGLFREDLRIGEDTEFHCRLRKKDRPAWAPQVVASHRYPESWGEHLEDQRDRGRLAALHWPRKPDKGPLVRPLWRSFDAVRAGMRASPPRDRWRILAAAPIVLAGFIAHERSFRRALGAALPAAASSRIAVILEGPGEGDAAPRAIVIVDPVMRQLIGVAASMTVPGRDGDLGTALSDAGPEAVAALLQALRYPVDGHLRVRLAGCDSEAELMADLLAGRLTGERLRAEAALRDASGTDNLAALAAIRPDWSRIPAAPRAT